MKALFVGPGPDQAEGFGGPLTGGRYRRLCDWCGWDLQAYSYRVERVTILEPYRGNGNAFSAKRAAEALDRVLGERVLTYRDLHGRGYLHVVLFGRDAGEAVRRWVNRRRTPAYRIRRMSFFEPIELVEDQLATAIPAPTRAWSVPLRKRVARYLNSRIGKPLGLAA